MNIIYFLCVIFSGRNCQETKGNRIGGQAIDFVAFYLFTLNRIKEGELRRKQLSEDIERRHQQIEEELRLQEIARKQQELERKQVCKWII
jgi:hypothetical protein